MERTSGLYWVRYKNQRHWTIAAWNGASWSIFGQLTTVGDDYFEEIFVRCAIYKKEPKHNTMEIEFWEDQNAINDELAFKDKQIAELKKREAKAAGDIIDEFVKLMINENVTPEQAKEKILSRFK